MVRSPCIPILMWRHVIISSPLCNIIFLIVIVIATPIHVVNMRTDMGPFLQELSALPYKEGHALLNKKVRALGENIPPLVNAYMNLSPTMKSFGTAINPPFFGGVETGILVTMADIYESKKERHVNSYIFRKEFEVRDYRCRLKKPCLNKVPPVFLAVQSQIFRSMLLLGGAM